METPRRGWGARAPELSLIGSLTAFLFLGTLYARQLPVWHEVVSALPSAGYRVLDASERRRSEERLPLEPSCTDPSPAWFAYSSSRPNLGVCAAGQTLPLMVMSYASGLSTWPFAIATRAGLDTFALRLVWLWVAALSLLLLFRLVSRVADRFTAALACALTAVSTPFVMINAILLPFETLPATFCVAALALFMGPRTLSDAPPATPSVARTTAGALLVGLALAANLKAIFFVAPLALLAWRSGLRWREARAQHVVGAVMGLGLPLAPTVFFAVADPQGGFLAQFAQRAEAASSVTLDRVVTEPLLLVNFVADLPSYADLVQQRGGPPISWLHVAVAMPLLYCVGVGVAHLAGRPHGSRLAAACGVVIATYFFVSLFLYRQFPGGNYSPLSDVFGVAMAAGCVDGSTSVHGWLTRRGHPTPPAWLIACGFAAALAVGGAYNLLRRVDSIVRVPMSTNSMVLRGLVSHLSSVPDRDTMILTTTYNDAGVLDALGHGELRAVQIHDALASCEHAQEGMQVCLRSQLRWILTRRDVLPVRITIPESVAIVDRPVEVARATPEALRQASEELGLDTRVERRFGLRDGTSVTALYRVEAPPGWTPPPAAP